MSFSSSKFWNFNIDDYLNPWIPRPPWHLIPYPVAHFLGHRSKPPRKIPNIPRVLWTFIGIFCSIAIIEVTNRSIPLFSDHGAPLIVGSFGAAAILEFYAIESPLAQPKNAILGHFMAAIIGVAMKKAFRSGHLIGHPATDLTWLAGALSCATATAVMALTDTVHPPAGATALIAVVNADVARLDWYLLPVILYGSVMMIAVALLINNIQQRFPVYWWTSGDVGGRWGRKTEQDNGSGDSLQKGDSTLVGDHDVSSSRMETGQAGQEPQILVRRGQVILPEGLYVTPEERLVLEELKARL